AVAVASPLVELAFGGDGVLSAQALPPAPFNAVAGPDRGVMRHRKTYLNGGTGVGQQPRRPRLPGGPPPQAPPPARPPQRPPAVAWSQVSGPGTVTFADPKSPVTTALFSAPGEYVLQMAADNGTAKATSTLVVKVELPPPPEQLRFVVTRPYAVTGPFWSSRVKALITSWIPYCIDQCNRTDIPAGRGDGGIDNFVEAAKAL